MEKLRQGPVLHLGVKGVDDDDDDSFIFMFLHNKQENCRLVKIVQKIQELVMMY
jgi:hypothetical protein